jgi:hypothetical protein
MFTKTALVILLVLGAVAVSSAHEFDLSLGNRYPIYNEPPSVPPFRSDNAARTGAPRPLINNPSYRRAHR